MKDTLEWKGWNGVDMAHHLGISLDEITSSPINNSLIIWSADGGKYVAKVGELVPKDFLAPNH